MTPKENKPDEPQEILNRCTCSEGYEEHSCPYQSDVNNDDEFKCNCCPYCTQNCADDI